MLLETLSNKGPHPKRCMRSSLDISFRQVHRGRSLDDDKVLHGFFPPGPRPTRSVRIISILPVFFVPQVERSAFIDSSSSVKKTRLSKTSCLELSSRFLFERVWVTQRLPCIPPGVALDKTPSIRRGKFRMGHLTSSLIHPYQV